MTLRPLNPEKLTERTKEWAQLVAGTAPVTVPVHPLAPEHRFIFNVRDFCKQHGTLPVYGWRVTRIHDMILRAHFYAVVRYHGKMFSITRLPEGEKELVFFEDKLHTPRIVSTHGNTQIMYTFHPMAWPEQNPSRAINVVHPDDNMEIAIDMPDPPRRYSYPPPAASRPSAYKFSARNEPARLAAKQEEKAVVHPQLRLLARH